MTRRIPFVIAVLSALATIMSPAEAQTSDAVYRVQVTGVVELGLAPFIERSLEEAAAAGAVALVLDMDTPGGRVDAAERISDALTDASVPVYTFVNRRAYSAGALIALSTDRIYMRPGSVIGAATPVDGAGTKASEKIVSAMRSQMRALAENAGLDPEVAAAMVDEDVQIDGIIEEGKLLTLTTTEAVAVGYAEEVVDFEAFLAELGHEGATVVTVQANWAERVVRFFSNPVVAPFLLTLGFLGLVTEVKTPTFGMAGAAGVLSLSLFFGSHMIIGLAGLEDLLIFGAGLALVGVEVLLIPGFGLFGLLGGVGILAGLYLSLLGGLPVSEDFTQAGLVLSTTILLIAVSAWVMIRTLPNSSRWAKSGIFLFDRTDRDIGYESAESRSDLIDVVGKAITDLRPSGTALFGDERIDVVSESEWITEGTQVKVVSAEGYRHVVRALPALEDSVEEA
jgi:membrane-bound serine protease (ClpP class)